MADSFLISTDIIVAPCCKGLMLNSVFKHINKTDQ